MDATLFERLLYEEESTTLDFKKEQYRFVKASDHEKSELLKDILGFTNAWRRSEAYILIGVEDVRGGRGNVVGILASDHLDDHSLQQFVNNLTNRPVRFHYEAFGFEGKQVGIIRIEEQARPIYLKHDYGKLQKEKVYIRRGSSTDPTKPASIEEIAQMGAANVGKGDSLEPDVEIIDGQGMIDSERGPEDQREAKLRARVRVMNRSASHATIEQGEAMLRWYGEEVRVRLTTRDGDVPPNRKPIWLTGISGELRKKGPDEPLLVRVWLWILGQANPIEKQFAE